MNSSRIYLEPAKCWSLSDTLGPQEQRLTKMGIFLTEDFTPSVAMRKGKAMHMRETGENQTQMLVTS